MDNTKNTDIKSLNIEELTEYIELIGEKKFRAKQLYEWMHVHLARTYDEMTNLSKKLRDDLSKNTDYVSLNIEDLQVSKLDGTRKYLFALSDGNCVESVMMRYKHGISVCISSQVGCKMGCSFCASTIGGFIRNLTPSEMLDQIYAISRDSGERVSNIVVMGTGEPLDNYDNLLKFIEIITDENGLNISRRNITVSTCGLVPKIYDLADENLTITLALSLHASSQAKREAIMPVAKTYNIEDVVKAMEHYANSTKRRITYEYTLIAGVNDSSDDANELANLIGKQPCHINLIPVNPVTENNYRASDTDAVLAFKKKLEKNAINVTIRREMGRDIDGACGQLRRKHMKNNTTVMKEG
ncbi:MAG: 23S rRNA (adenine(2503)-C(2))-methyltransferase RlmN [Lachnospiraceae bacterium]|nr:23S rRNA (adenine(2503)-C(2))-methyltransferase RlmN [Lachnospiraceae bacterium]